MLNNDKESKKYRVFSNGFEDKLNLLFQYLILINLVMKRANSFDTLCCNVLFKKNVKIRFNAN